MVETAAKVQERIAKQKQLHMNKTMNSCQEFQNARVTSCSGVLMRSGQTVAIAFHNPNPKPMDLSAMKSSETISVAQ